MADHSTTIGSLRCLVVTPEATIVDTPASFVALPLYDGEAGIGPRRSPLIGRLGYGELRLRTAGGTQHYYVDGGFVQVADNIVSVLTNRALPAERLDSATASEQLRTAIASRAAGRDQMAIRDRQILQARGQLRVANRAAAGNRFEPAAH